MRVKYKIKIFLIRLNYLFSLPGRIAIEYNTSLNEVKGLFLEVKELKPTTRKQLISQVYDCLNYARSNDISVMKSFNELYKITEK